MRERENLTKGEEEESGGKDERKRNEGQQFGEKNVNH